MSDTNLKQYLHDVLNGKDKTIAEISEDLTTKDRFQPMVQNLQVTEETLESCLQGIAASLLTSSSNDGCLVALLLLSIELDSFHSAHSAWYKRDVLIETLHSIFTEYDNKFHKKHYYHFQGLSLFLLVLSFILIVL